MITKSFAAGNGSQRQKSEKADKSTSKGTGSGSKSRAAGNGSQRGKK